eukprot:5884945-Pyramimonas_sp.AAC.1
MNTAEDKFRDLLNAVVCITRCAMKDERERPSVNAARWARKIVITMAKEESPGAELAKALVAHRAGEEFMTFALAHAKAGLEDEAASNGFDVSLEIFEHDLEPIFDDAVSFLRSGNNGKAVTVESFTPYLESCQKMAVACQQALQRWSPSALETNTESLASHGHNKLAGPLIRAPSSSSFQSSSPHPSPSRLLYPLVLSSSSSFLRSTFSTLPPF